MSDIDVNERREAFIERMKMAGCQVVEPKSNELQIDIDNEAQWDAFHRNIECLIRNVGPGIGIEEHVSKSGYPCRHITVTLPFDVEPWQRIAFQAALGSDPIRELLSGIRLMRGDVAPTIFIEDGPDFL